MTWKVCDHCGESSYTPANPFVECRTPRPSDPSEMTCVLAGHKTCLRISGLSTGTEGGMATPEMWAVWLQSPEAKAAGFARLG
jgi:hypothetical protein